MNRHGLTLSLLLILALWTAPAAVGQDLQADFMVESRLLDQDLEQYDEARAREQRAISEMRQLSVLLDATFADPNVPLTELRRIEALLSASRETAFLRAKETGEIRLRVYDRMERLTQLAQAVERRNPATFSGPTAGIDGTWQIALEPIDVFGLMKLVLTGNVVSGSYRLSNGHRGSLQGTLFGDTVQLNVIDSEQGQVGQLEGTLDASSGALRGRWNAMELGAGRPAAGSWSALALADEAVDLEP